MAALISYRGTRQFPLRCQRLVSLQQIRFREAGALWTVQARLDLSSHYRGPPSLPACQLDHGTEHSTDSGSVVEVQACPEKPVHYLNDRTVTC